jgi:hypothetical protein
MAKDELSKLRRVVTEYCDTHREDVALALLKRAGYKISIRKETSHPLSWVTHLHPFYKSVHKFKSWSYYVIPEGLPTFYTVSDPSTDLECKLTLPELLEFASNIPNPFPLKPNLRVPPIINSYQAKYCVEEEDYVAIPLKDKPIMIQVVYDRYFRFNKNAPRYKITVNYNVGSDSQFTTARKASSKGIGKLLQGRSKLLQFIKSLGRNYTSFIVNLICYPNVFYPQEFLLLDVLFVNNEDLSLETYKMRYTKVRELSDKFGINRVRPTTNKLEAMSKFPLVLFKSQSSAYLQNNRESLLFHSLKILSFFIRKIYFDKERKNKFLILGAVDHESGEMVDLFELKYPAKSIVIGELAEGKKVQIYMSGHIYWMEKATIFKLVVKDDIKMPTTKDIFNR